MSLWRGLEQLSHTGVARRGTISLPYAAPVVLSTLDLLSLFRSRPVLFFLACLCCFFSVFACSSPFRVAKCPSDNNADASGRSHGVVAAAGVTIAACGNAIAGLRSTCTMHATDTSVLQAHIYLIEGRRITVEYKRRGLMNCCSQLASCVKQVKLQLMIGRTVTSVLHHPTIRVSLGRSLSSAATVTF